MEIGKAIRELRKRYGMSQKELAEASGLSINAICSFERCHFSPSVSTLQKLADTPEIPLPVFLFAMLSEDDFPQEKKILFPILKQIIIQLCTESTNQ